MEIKFWSWLVTNVKYKETWDELIYTYNKNKYKEYIEWKWYTFENAFFEKEKQFLTLLNINDIFVDFRVSDLPEWEPWFFDFEDFINSEYTKIKIKAISKVINIWRQIKTKSYEHWKVNEYWNIEWFIWKPQEIVFDKEKYKDEWEKYLFSLIKKYIWSDWINIQNGKIPYSEEEIYDLITESNIEKLITEYTKYLLQENECFEDLILEKDKFIKEFNLKKVKDFNLDDYCVWKWEQKTFCYLLERSEVIGLKLWSIRWWSANKFWVYYNKQNWDYKTIKKFHNDWNEALTQIKETIERIILSSDKEIISNEEILGHTVRSKIFYLYHSEKLIPIFSVDKIREIYLKLWLEQDIIINKHEDYLNIQNKLLEIYNNIHRDEKSTLSFMYFLFNYTKNNLDYEVEIIDEEDNNPNELFELDENYDKDKEIQKLNLDIKNASSKTKYGLLHTKWIILDWKWRYKESLECYNELIKLWYSDPYIIKQRNEVFFNAFFEEIKNSNKKFEKSKNISSNIYFSIENKNDLKNITPQIHLQAILENTKKDDNLTLKYSFDDLDTLNIMTSLKVKPFAILTWISWVWKSLRVKQIAKAIYNTEENEKKLKENGLAKDIENIYEDFYKHIAVKPNWTDNTALFGYYNPLTKEYVNGELNEFINKAFLNPDKPFFVMLDEINLARVEYYMSDILSHMEVFDDEGFSKFIPLVWVELDQNELEKKTFIKDNKYLIRKKDNWKYEVWYILSKNVFFVGTANIDETTHWFSNKVLDRCSVIEIENDYGVEVKHDYGIDGKFDFCNLSNFWINKENFNFEFLIDLYLNSDNKNYKFLEILKLIKNKELIYEKILNKLYEETHENSQNYYIFLLKYFNYDESKLLDLIKKYSEGRSYKDYSRQLLLLDKSKIDEYRKQIKDECEIKPGKIIEDLNILSITNLVSIIDNFNEKNWENIIYDLILKLYDKSFDLISNKKAIPELFNIIYDFNIINNKYERSFFDLLEKKDDYSSILDLFSKTKNTDIINKIINLFDKYDSFSSSDKILMVKFLYNKWKIKLDEYINYLKWFLDDDYIKFSASIILSNYIYKLDDKTKERFLKIFEEIISSIDLSNTNFILNDIFNIDNIEIVKNIFSLYNTKIKQNDLYKNSFLIWLSLIWIKNKEVYDYLVEYIEEFKKLYLIQIKLLLEELFKIDNSLFSHRVAWDIKKYVHEFYNYYWKLSIDYSIKQKILPKIKWDYEDLEENLNSIKEIILPYEKSSKKLEKMLLNWENLDYITFWK